MFRETQVRQIIPSGAPFAEFLPTSPGTCTRLHLSRRVSAPTDVMRLGVQRNAPCLVRLKHGPVLYLFVSITMKMVESFLPRTRSISALLLRTKTTLNSGYEEPRPPF